MSMYPLKFEPIIKEKIWGGRKLQTVLNKNLNGLLNGGESWEISAVPGDESRVANGPLIGLSLDQLVKKYPNRLMGQSVVDQFGEKFPLLIKFIDANANLSVQVHPDNALAEKRHNSFGKSEMWYIMQADEGSQIISGFKNELTKDEYCKRVEENRLIETLAHHNVKKGEVYYIPAGRVHAICAGVLLAEIQQTSDITYRIYDYDRKDANGQKRELHTEFALEANDYTVEENYKTDYTTKNNDSSHIIDTPYFKTNLISLDQQIEKDYTSLDSFVIYVCVEGDVEIGYGENETISLKMGESILIPAELNSITLNSLSAKLLEVYL